MRESKSSSAEVDYVISEGNLIVPIEVKAGQSGSMKSLAVFVDEKKVDFAVRFDLNPPSLFPVKLTLSNQNKVKYDLLSLPLFFANQTRRLIDEYRAS